VAVAQLMRGLCMLQLGSWGAMLPLALVVWRAS
jgi:hypothetical protein